MRNLYDAGATIVPTSALAAADDRAFVVLNPNCPTVFSVSTSGGGLRKHPAWNNTCVAVDHFVVAGSSLFVLHASNRLLEQNDLSSSAPAVRLTTASDVGPLAAGPAYVYVAGATQILAYPRVVNDAGAGIPIANVNAPRALGIDGDSLYWVNQDGAAVTISGAPNTNAMPRLLHAAEAPATRMVLANAWVVWSDEKKRIVAVSKDGTIFHTVASDQSVTALATNGTAVFWGTKEGLIRSAALP